MFHPVQNVCLIKSEKRLPTKSKVRGNNDREKKYTKMNRNRNKLVNKVIVRGWES